MNPRSGYDMWRTFIKGEGDGLRSENSEILLQTPADERNEVLLGNPDASSLIDLGDSFSVIKDMRIAPIDRRTLTVLALAAALPMVPVVFLATPADEVLRMVLKMLG
jgi:hypothetical protein